MKIIRYLSLVCLLLATGACSSVRVVKTEPATNFSLTNYRTFAFSDIESAGDLPQSGFYRSQIDALKKAIETELKQKGLRRVDTQPDLMMNIGIAVDEKTQTRETNIRTDPPFYIGQRRYSWRSQEVPVGKYRQGTVDVHLIDPKRNEMVWQGVVEGILPKKPEKLQKLIDEGMAKLFARL
ncbi:DUF4136 domain-containing protein [Larkinella arboricola]|uniref:Uncharacterized protein DUF4136 n=1 Tax=Larkinella arboricola TaxID=643671 RepID=A0A327X9V9_LARAB|nr:DUF4136 domain-containing protein [Larkinella arboricola]RAK00457.1 uncharacterized protein DUF4136 [Larkinella arboricola]